MIKLFLTKLFVFILAIVALGQPYLSIPVTISDDATPPNVKVLNFGIDPLATDTIDVIFDESDLPPAPPVGNFDARFVLPKNGFNGTLSSYKDYRGATIPFSGIKEHRLKYQRGSNQGGTQINIAYNFPPSISVLLQDIITGTIINTTISGSGTYTVTNPDVFGALKFFVTYSPKTLNLTALIEGFYNGVTMIPDTVKVELRNASSPYALVDQANVVLNSSGIGSASFYYAADATFYYIVIKHRNGLETWSATPVAFSGGVLNYNFTTAATQAYGGNQVLVGSKYCIYSGDVSNGVTAGVQDGFIDIFDDFEVYNDSYSATYRLLTDLNLDGFVDIFDDLYVYNNSYNGVTSSYPTSSRPSYLRKEPKILKNEVQKIE